MVEVHQLSRRDARRIAVQAQLLTRQRPTGLVETVRQLPLLQIEPTNAVAPSTELVLWSRLGSSLAAHELWDAVDEQRLIEVHQSLRAPEDIAMFRAEMDCLVAFSACPQDLVPVNGLALRPTEAHFEVLD